MPYTQVTDDEDDNLAAYHNELATGLDAVEVEVDNLNTGWIASSWASLTRTSNTVFTTTTDVTGVIQKRTKLKLTDTTIKYFVVKSVTFGSGTSTITVLPTSDYVLAGNPSAIYYSHMDSPFGWPDLFNYAATVTSNSGSITAYTVNSCQWRVLGKTINFLANITITTQGTATGNGLVTIPTDGISVIAGTGRENAINGSQLTISGGSTTLSIFTYNNSQPFFGDGTNWSLWAIWDF